MTRTRARQVFLTIALGLLAACDAPSADDAGGADADVDAGGGGSCESSSDCDDGLFCNGDEACDPSASGADTRGCVEGAAPCAGACDEGAGACAGCEGPPDADEDGFDSIPCGGSDCDDADPARFPGNTEICDAADVDEDCDPSTFGVRDLDGDGEPDAACCNTDASGVSRCGTDCDDARSSVSPRLPEVCDGLDNDCNGDVDDGVLATFYVDADGDGHGSMAPGAETREACFAPSGFVVSNNDCDDTNGAINPGNPELCDTATPPLDENCDGEANPAALCECNFVGARSCSELGQLGPCAAGTFTCNGGVVSECSIAGTGEVCNGVDDDCDGEADDGVTIACFPDSDDDGYPAAGASPEPVCPDAGRPDVGRCPAGFTDRGPLAATTDCAPSDPARNPGASEACNGLDDDCDTGVDEEPSTSLTCALDDAFGRCLEGACRVLGCEPGFGDCDGDASSGCETDVLSDAAHCGACGVACGIGGACVDGVCDPVVDLSSGTDHTCAVREAGQVICWGAGNSGKLGNTTVTDQGSPTLVRNVDDAVEVAAGNNHTCARRSDGTAVCWGAGGAGQMGDGSTPGQRLVPGGPVGDGAALTGIEEIASGRAHSCARITTGDVYCWGSNSDGQIGAGAASVGSDVPVLVPGLANAVQLALGHNHSCARISGGDVMCWGLNDRGQVGDGTTSGPVYAPTLVTGFANIESRDISAGRDHTCVRRVNSRVACWGANQAGQLGVDPTGLSERPSAAVVAGLDLVSDVQLGHTHSCARRLDRGLWCWGSDGNGELGDGAVGPDVFTPQPMRVTADTELSDARASMGDGGEGVHCVARATGQIVCVGQQVRGRLGNGLVNAATLPYPVTVRDVTQPTTVAAGEEHSCARFDVGRAGCWGDHRQSQLGTGDDAATVFGRADPSGVLSSSDLRFVRSGRFFSCALRTNGQVVCWGANDVGQLGNDDVPNPRNNPGAVSLPSPAIDVRAGGAFACALLTDRAVWCWGRGVNGQLGNGSMTDSAVPVQVIGLDRTPVRLTLGGRHACVTNADASIQCWGHDNRRQLNDGPPGGSEPIPVLSLERGLLGLAAGGEHTCGITPAGLLRCWGANGSGQLGRPALQNLGADFVETAISDWVQVEGSGTHTCARRAGGEVWCWGDATEGRLGNGMLIQQEAPVMTLLPTSDAGHLACGTEHGCAVHGDGSVSCWGNDEFGQLGDGGAPTDQASPVSARLLP